MSHAKASFDMKNVCHTEISLDVDADRDGVVEKDNPNKVSVGVSV